MHEPQGGPAPGEGAELLDAIAVLLRRYVVLSQEQADAAALWVVHTHAFGAAEVTPYLWITSAEMGSGKTRLLEALELLVAKPWLTGRVTAAVLTRKIDAEHPTLLLDESDAAFASGKEYSEALRGILNTGHRIGGKTSVCVGQGATITYKDLSTFCPKAFAGIGTKAVPGTVADRAIRVELKRKAPDEHVHEFRIPQATADAADLRMVTAEWGEANEIHLRDARPDLPAELSDRAKDGWEPLIAIADLAGGEWPARARTAAITLSSREAVEDRSVGTELLRDVRDVFNERETERMFSAELCKALGKREESAWSTFGERRREPGLSPQDLARLLRPFGIRPKQLREGEKTGKGYTKESFKDTWRRYLPEIAELAVTAGTTALDQAILRTSGSSHEAHVTARQNGSIPSRELDVTGVTDDDHDESGRDPMDEGEAAALAFCDGLVESEDAEEVPTPA
jgi:Protein of unknown function (DUF3631)